MPKQDSIFLDVQTYLKNATPKRISSAVLVVGAIVLVWHWDELRYISIASVRIGRVSIAATKAVLDYKKTYGKEYSSEIEKLEAISACHTRAAGYTLKALLANGGVFIKLGQHISSSIVLPIEWQVTMRPCLDSCEQSSLKDVEQVFFEDTGMKIETIFSEFDAEPIGVASLAQVHVAVHRATGQKVAVKIQHPGLQEFASVDLVTTDITLRVVKRLFPDFEFSWLGREMRENLPLEMNFVHEASNAARVSHNFESVPNSPLYVPKVLSATKRTLVMEFVEGAKINDKDFLAIHGIDRNRVSQEIAKIFSEQVYIHGFFHADPHQ
ncbi:4009_t:CDS:2, partial [Acaulospora colombiana]